MKLRIACIRCIYNAKRYEVYVLVWTFAWIRLNRVFYIVYIMANIAILYLIPELSEVWLHDACAFVYVSVCDCGCMDKLDVCAIYVVTVIAILCVILSFILMSVCMVEWKKRQWRKYETGMYVQERHSDWMTMIRTILFEVLAIASHTFLPSFRQYEDGRTKKNICASVAANHSSSHFPTFS